MKSSPGGEDLGEGGLETKLFLARVAGARGLARGNGQGQRGEKVPTAWGANGEAA